MPGQYPPGFENWTPEQRHEWLVANGYLTDPAAQPTQAGSSIGAIGQFLSPVATTNTGPIETQDRPYGSTPAATFDRYEEERKKREAAQMYAMMGGVGY